MIFLITSHVVRSIEVDEGLHARVQRKEFMGTYDVDTDKGEKVDNPCLLLSQQAADGCDAVLRVDRMQGFQSVFGLGKNHVVAFLLLHQVFDHGAVEVRHVAGSHEGMKERGIEEACVESAESARIRDKVGEDFDAELKIALLITWVCDDDDLSKERSKEIEGTLDNRHSFNPKEGFVLAHPEASCFVTSPGANRAPSPTQNARKVWQDFAGNKALLAQHRVNSAELKVLSQINLLGKVTAPRNFLFILNAIRQAVDED